MAYGAPDRSVSSPPARWSGRFEVPLLALALLSSFGLLPCPFAVLLSLPCPGCGLSRAARQLLQGDVQGALALHPLSPVVVPLVAAGLLWMLRAPSGSSLHSATRSRFAHAAASVASVVLVALLIGVWIARFLGALGGPAPVQ